MRAIFFITCAIIVYGSLYPFNFSVSHLSDLGIAKLLNFDIRETRLSDLISNVVLFIPFGLLSCAAFLKTKRAQHHIIFLIIGFVFAFVIQVLQLWTVGRVPWGGDAVWNAVGCMIGFSLFAVLNLEAFNQVRTLAQFKQISFALACALIILKLSPFAPALDLQMLKDNIKALINNPSIQTYWLFEHTLFWLTSFFLLHLAKPEWASLKRLSVIVGIVLTTKFLVVSNNINLSQLLAGALSLVIWSVFYQRINAWLLGVLMLFAIAGNGLYPFELRTVPGEFNWLPFTGSIRGNILLNILAMSKKLLFYGATVWLLYLSIKSLKKAALICASLLLVSEFTQQYFTSSVPESTDVFLVLIITFVLATLLKMEPLDKLTGTLQGSSVNASQPVESKPIETVSSRGFSARFIKVVPIHQSLHYIHSLDGLRAIAALAVFVVHFQQFSGVGGSFGVIDFERLMINGNTGVGLFFTLSGFLLSVPFWQKLRDGSTPPLRQYFINRVVRIVPIYYLCIFALLVLKGFSGADANFNNLISHMLFAHNLKDYQVMSLNPPFWTLAVEFQFYLILPLFFLLFAKIGFKGSQVLTLLLIPGIYFAYRSMMYQLEISQDWPIAFGLIWPLGVQINSVDGMALKYSLFAHLPHFLIGVFSASLWQYKDKIAPPFCDVLFWLAVLMSFTILSTQLDDTLQLDYGRYNYPFIPILLAVIVFTAPLARSARAILELSVIKWMGIISYGVYVFHYPIQKGLERIFTKLGSDASDHTLFYAVVSLALTLFVAHVSYVLLERPILEKFKSKNKTHTTGGSVKQASFECESAQQASATHSLAEQNSMRPTLPNEVLAASTSAGKGFNRSAYSSTHDQKEKPMSKHNSKKSGREVWLLVGASTAIGAAIIVFLNLPVSHSFRVEQASWAGNLARPIIFDHHAHTTYSDGVKSIEQLTELAYFSGCDAFSITDHSQNQNSLSKQKMQEIQAMRQKYSGLFIFAGIELGMPSYEGREHVNILATPKVESDVLFGVIKALQGSSNMQKAQRDLHVLDAIRKSHVDGANSAVAIYNHPSRKDLNETGDENLSDIKWWNSNYPIIIGMAGAPGHQNKEKTGSYETNILPIDRWDPAVATVGGTWDQLLSEGARFWGAIASSDYHNDNMDYAPCEFSRMHLTVPERSYQGIIDALKAGTFWADHGNLLASYEFGIQLEDLGSLTLPGGTLRLFSPDQLISVNLSIDRGHAYVDDFMRVDIITNCGTEEVVSSSTYMPPEQSRLNSFLSVSPLQKSCFVRSRVVRETADVEDLSAYSNPIFIEINR